MTEEKEIIRLSDNSFVLHLGQNSAFLNILDASAIDDVIGDESAEVTPVKVDETNRYRGYVPWGDDNQRSYKLMAAVKQDEVLAENNHFNALTCYASGLRYRNKKGEEIQDDAVKVFFRYNRPAKYMLNQCADMKYFLFSVSVIILNKEGSKILQIRHKEAVHCRFESCNPKTGKIEHLFYGDFEDKTPKLEELEVIPVLDYDDPLGDLEERFGRCPNADGNRRNMQQYDKNRKFAVINMLPTVGNKYYPFSPWWAIFNSGWLKYKTSIPKIKLEKLKLPKIKYKVDVSRDYFPGIFSDESITDEDKQRQRRDREIEAIREFLSNSETSSEKVFVGGCYVKQDGTNEPKVAISVLDNKKEGGELIEDSAEASNMICYAMGVHPSLIGAYPGKSAGQYSGSVQRELFTIKQALEKPYHDILLEPYSIIAAFNGWSDVVFDIPVITLTTLDKGKDAEENTLRNE